MGRREQRSRKHLPEGTICYLCGKPVYPTDQWDRDHVPPRRFFGKSVRNQYQLQLDWLPTHCACNTDCKPDEEYFTLTFVGHHLASPSAQSVWNDVRRGAAEGHATGLIQTIIGQFGKVVLPNGTGTFAYHGTRVRRVVWKLARGLYTLNTGQLLPEAQPHNIEVVPRSEAPQRVPDHPWLGVVVGTGSLGRYPGVFDYKWIGYIDGTVRWNLLALLLWDGLIVLVAFHDSRCCCERCVHSASDDHSAES